MALNRRRLGPGGELSVRRVAPGSALHRRDRGLKPQVWLGGRKKSETDTRITQTGQQGALRRGVPLHPDAFWDCLQAETRRSSRRQKEEPQGL